MMLKGIKFLIDKKQFQKAEIIMNEQMFRAWAWGRSNPFLLMNLYDLHALLSIFLGRED